MPSGKAPGLDRFSLNFYKVLAWITLYSNVNTPLEKDNGKTRLAIPKTN